MNRIVTIKLNKGLIKIESKGMNASELLSMLINALSTTILTASNGNRIKKDELLEHVIKILKPPSEPYLKLQIKNILSKLKEFGGQENE